MKEIISLHHINGGKAYGLFWYAVNKFEDYFNFDLPTPDDYDPLDGKTHL